MRWLVIVTGGCRILLILIKDYISLGIRTGINHFCWRVITGKQENVRLFIGNPNFIFIKGDIKDLDTCMDACDGVDNVFEPDWSFERGIKAAIEW